MPSQTTPRSVGNLPATASRKPAALQGPGIHLKDLSGLVTRTGSQNHPQFKFERLVEVTAVALNGMLDRSRKHCGSSTQISRSGISIKVTTGVFHHSQPLLLGLRCEQLGLVYAGLTVRRAEPGHAGGTLVEADFGGPAADVLSAESRVPDFDRDLLIFTLPATPAVYDNWTRAGVMRKVLLDKAMVCPKCGALPSFRNACRKCGSGRVTSDRMIHHFRCAHVDFVHAYETGDGNLVCPKCRLNKLVVGSDFEFLSGEYRCQSCAWRDSDTELYGHCLRCNNRFESHQARHQELFQYHVRRLDPLAVTAELA